MSLYTFCHNILGSCILSLGMDFCFIESNLIRFIVAKELTSEYIGLVLAESSDNNDFELFHILLVCHRRGLFRMRTFAKVVKNMYD